MSRLFRLLTVVLLVATPAMAQQKPVPEKVKTSEQKQPPEKSTKDREPSAGPVKAPAPEGLPVNIRIELTITDQRGETTPITKTVSMIASDRSWSRIRTSGDVRTPMGFRPVILNVDARPVLTKDNRARVELTIEYRPVAAEADTEKSTTPNVNESLAVILEDGKPMLISQSADPVTDRKVKVEAKVSILK
jgi:hypothetical protein